VVRQQSKRIERSKKSVECKKRKNKVFEIFGRGRYDIIKVYTKVVTHQSNRCNKPMGKERYLCKTVRLKCYKMA
jgi:hypothetical protein